MNKEEIRNEIWATMEREGVARFPGTRGRIPNFVGAERAASLLMELPAWQGARVIKANPDSPQGPARLLALKEGKKVYMAVPRLRDERCFVELDPARIRNLKEASSIKGAFKYGSQVSIDEVPEIDLVLCGSVAVNKEGARVGKGGGYSDLEFALLTQVGRIKRETVIVTTLHPLQVVSHEIPMNPHDIPVDFIVTPEGIIETRTLYERPKGVYWDILPEDKIEAVPILKRLGKS